jgi:uncharacterized protein (UPF0218 family)
MPIRADVLQELKKPFGKLILDRDVTEERIRKSISGARKIVTVGDATTERLVSFGIIPDLAVIDFRERRSVTNKRIDYPATEFGCTNPSGTISRRALQVLEIALKARSRGRIIVEGEEDLLALPLIYLLPTNSVVMYGQPLEGIVAVKITKSKQHEAKALIDRIIPSVALSSGPEYSKVGGKARTRRSKSGRKKENT